MPLKEAESMYRAMLESGELFDLFPDLTGIWKEDKYKFIQGYNFNISIINEDDDIFDEDFDNEYDY